MYSPQKELEETQKPKGNCANGEEKTPTNQQHTASSRHVNRC